MTVRDREEKRGDKERGAEMRWQGRTWGEKGKRRRQGEGQKQGGRGGDKEGGRLQKEGGKCREGGGRLHEGNRKKDEKFDVRMVFNQPVGNKR